MVSLAFGFPQSARPFFFFVYEKFRQIQVFVGFNIQKDTHWSLNIRYRAKYFADRPFEGVVLGSCMLFFRRIINTIAYVCVCAFSEYICPGKLKVGGFMPSRLLQYDGRYHSGTERFYSGHVYNMLCMRHRSRTCKLSSG